jgi:hypothetical protein
MQQYYIAAIAIIRDNNFLLHNISRNNSDLFKFCYVIVPL